MLTPEQIAIRRTRVGGSEIGALLGVDPHKTALDVFAGKVLPPVEEEPAPHLAWGHDVERSILAFHGRQFARIEEPGTLLHPKHPAICATPDGLGVREGGSRVVLEVKNSQWHQSHRWGEPGTDDAPLLYVAQVQMELGIALSLGDVEGTADLVASIAGAPPVEIDAKVAKIRRRWLVDGAATPASIASFSAFSVQSSRLQSSVVGVDTVASSTILRE